MPITIYVDVLGSIFGKLIAVESVDVVAIAIHVSIGPLCNFSWECVVCISNAITVGIQIVETNFGV